VKIITIPHQTLRRVATPVAAVDKRLLQFLDELGDTLWKKDNPRGVGLAAPQVDESLRVFTTLLPESGTRGDGDPFLRFFINPIIRDASEEMTFGDNPEEPILEGCLSIPSIYGPVPRHQWISVEFSELNDGLDLITKTEQFSGYAARVMQHEYDHLDGKLFIDYSVEHDLPLYKERGKKMDEMTSDMVKAFYYQSLTK
jgi:peptide deformylase